MGFRDFIKEIKGIKGERVQIDILHKLYGNQSVECNFIIIDDESRLGFHIATTNQDIYIDKTELRDFGIEKGTYFFAGEVMRIELKTI